MTYSYNAKVVRVVDGDTVVLNVDLGFRTWHESPFRMLGIDAPEINAAGTNGEDSRDWLRAVLPVGLAVRIETQRSADKYGRWLATIWTGESGVSVNEASIEARMSRPYDGGPR